MPNEDVRELVYKKKLKYQDIAAAMFITPEWLSRMLSKPLKDLDRERILYAIEKLEGTVEDDV